VTTAPHALDPDKVHRDLAFLTGCLREVLEEAGQVELARALEPEANDVSAGLASLSTEALAQGLSLGLHLRSIVEENAAASLRRELEREGGPEAVPALFGRCLAELRDEGVPRDEVLAGLARTRAELVLTAHPTEAKRATVLEHHRRLYLLLVQRESARWTPAEQGHIRDEIKGLLELLRQTGELFLEKPDVASERRNVVHYLRNVFPSVVPLVDERLADAWLHVQGAALPPHEPCALPTLTLGTWVGGDRDGHPLVTAEVTAQTLAELRAEALALLDHELAELAGLLSVSARRERSVASGLSPVPSALVERLAAMRAALSPGRGGAAALDRNPDEPLRQLVSGMRALLPVERHDAAREPVLGYREPGELDADLALAERAPGRARGAHARPDARAARAACARHRGLSPGCARRAAEQRPARARGGAALGRGGRERRQLPLVERA
jgi:phosphoenolpyruvate carboxylase